MAGDTGCRIYLAVNFMLVQIIAPVRQVPSRGFLKLVARLDLFLVRVAVGAEGLRMADFAGLFMLRRVELVLSHVTRPVIKVVQCRPPVGMTFAAHLRVSDVFGVLQCGVPVNGTGKQQGAGQGQNYKDDRLIMGIHHELS